MFIYNIVDCILWINVIKFVIVFCKLVLSPKSTKLLFQCVGGRTVTCSNSSSSSGSGGGGSSTRRKRTRKERK